MPLLCSLLRDDNSFIQADVGQEQLGHTHDRYPDHSAFPDNDSIGQLIT